MSVALKAAGLPSDSIILQIHENDATSYIKQAASFSEGLEDPSVLPALFMTGINYI